VWVLLLWPAVALAGAPRVEVEELPALAAPASNNAVALVVLDEGPSLYSFFGLEAGRARRNISARAWELRPGAGAWTPLDPIPGATARLASTAVTVAGAVWLFGGYTVAADGSEVSTPEVYRIEPRTGKAKHVSDMPVPVDDTVAFAYQDRFIYLVSGWHDLGNVNLVQVLDTRELAWSQATPYPGAPVFGHAGGMSGDRMLVCGGVRIAYPTDGAAREFLPSAECWSGRVAAGNVRRIAWQPVASPPGPPRYRAAAGADDAGRVVFAGGSDNPYNYDGIGYDGVPARPVDSVLRYDLEQGRWEQAAGWPGVGMDYRNLPFHDGWFYLTGGMLEGQKITRRVLRFRLGAAGSTGRESLSQ
jgi:hypothetical protein